MNHIRGFAWRLGGHLGCAYSGTISRYPERKELVD